MIVQYNSCTLFSYSYIKCYSYIDYYVLLWLLFNNTLYLLYCNWLVTVYLVYYISCTVIFVYHHTLTELHGFFQIKNCIHIYLQYKCLKFYMLHTRHITYWLLHNVRHELRIKWYGPLMYADTILAIFGHSKITPNFMTLASLPIRCFGHHLLAEISVCPQALRWEFQLYIFLGTTFRPTAQPSRLYILHTFYRNPTWLCETC